VTGTPPFGQRLQRRASEPFRTSLTAPSSPQPNVLSLRRPAAFASPLPQPDRQPPAWCTFTGLTLTCSAYSPARSRSATWRFLLLLCNYNASHGPAQINRKFRSAVGSSTRARDGQVSNRTSLSLSHSSLEEPRAHHGVASIGAASMGVQWCSPLIMSAVLRQGMDHAMMANWLSS
jgi:hypothetical protein